jgi:FHS family glucose/mannose:H+ symporter-like MFS transporter
MALVQWMMIAVLLVTGMGAALLGSVKLALAGRLHIDEARVGGLVSLFGFIMIPVILTAGFLTDLLGRRVVLLGGSLLLALSLGLLARARTYPLALAAVVLLSGGWSLLVNVGNVLTPLAFPGGLAFATNLANVFFGLGALLTPVAVAFLVRRTSWPAALTLVGGLALVPAALALGVDLAALLPPSPPEAATDTALGGGFRTVLADPVLWLCGLALFCYGPLEASMGAWATSYLVGRGVRAQTAAGLLSGFWLAFMASRLATAFSLPAGHEAVFILALAVLCVGVLSAVVVSGRPTTAMALVLAAGLVFGPVFPTLMAVLLGHFAAGVHGRAVGLLFAIGGIGWTVIPMLIGAYARRTSVQRGFIIAVAAAVGLCVVALVLAARDVLPGSPG